MAQEKTRNETTEGEDARSCCGNEDRESACPCGAKCGCQEKARWACLALLIGGLGFVAFRAARRRAGSAGPACCGA